MRLPDFHEISIVLAQSLFDPYDITLLDDDHEEGMAVAEKVIASVTLEMGRVRSGRRRWN